MIHSGLTKKYLSDARPGASKFVRCRVLKPETATADKKFPQSCWSAATVASLVGNAHSTPSSSTIGWIAPRTAPRTSKMTSIACISALGISPNKAIDKAVTSKQINDAILWFRFLSTCWLMIWPPTSELTMKAAPTMPICILVKGATLRNLSKSALNALMMHSATENATIVCQNPLCVKAVHH
ncbi:unnamed protein product [Phytophthora fragariaefolia]|uniref:Unnamed protein product n=1 Tax=Phytophthora fragariaefolia TaxID=1490495 RepID=A0A9W6XAI6_9STRA|nr:unnamed protein product [Phytophthora fragariaefolia]